MKREVVKKLRRGQKLTVDEIDFVAEEFTNKRDYGLVWENHPESVDLELKDGYFDIREVKKKRISTNPYGRDNLLIEGDNLHSLMALKEAGIKVDIIYIDPPYNTLNEEGFIFNDKIVDKEDSYRHSKWLSFMSKRLNLARDLLTDNGIILISIDNHEQANLRVLMDQIFGEQNFIENFIWLQASGNNNSTLASNRHEYVLSYGKNINQLNKKYFNQEKVGVEGVYNLIQANIKKEPKEIESILREYYKNNNVSKGLTNYNKVSKDKRVYRLSDLGNPGKGMHLNPDYCYELKNKATGEAYKMPKRGWLYKKETMINKINEGVIYLESEVPQLIRYLDDVIFENMPSYLYNTAMGSRELRGILGELTFDYPKPTSLVSCFLKACPNKKATVLDFFAGSGTTGQAVMELNKEDGGNRRFILCTNNENNICEEITYERNRRVITGEYAEEKVEPLPNNLSYYKVNIKNIDTLSIDEKKELDLRKNIYSILWKNEYNIVEKNDKYLIVEKDKKKAVILLANIVDDNMREAIEGKVDCIYIPKHLSRDKLLKIFCDKEVIYY